MDCDQTGRNCDLVMKGGITSGVVYPLAIYELSRSYRFQNIGGTSAGAVAAVVAASAEYGREVGGFEKIKALPDSLSKTLLEKFQPVPELASLFNMTIAVLRGGLLNIAWSLLKNYWFSAAIGAVPGAALLAYSIYDANWGFGLLGVACMVLLSLGLAGGSVVRQIARELPGKGYGMCPGVGQPGFGVRRSPTGRTRFSPY
jgi:hypothetical protein